MKIICTEEEKEDLLDALTQTCLYVDNDKIRCRYSGQIYQCRECLERHIKFDIVSDCRGEVAKNEQRNTFQGKTY